MGNSNEIDWAKQITEEIDREWDGEPEWMAEKEWKKCFANGDSVAAWERYESAARKSLDLKNGYSAYIFADDSVCCTWLSDAGIDMFFASSSDAADENMHDPGLVYWLTEDLERFAEALAEKYGTWRELEDWCSDNADEVKNLYDPGDEAEGIAIDEDRGIDHGDGEICEIFSISPDPVGRDVDLIRRPDGTILIVGYNTGAVGNDQNVNVYIFSGIGDFRPEFAE